MNKSLSGLLNNIREFKDVINEVKYMLPDITGHLDRAKKNDTHNKEINDAINFAVNSLMNDPYIALGVSRKDPDDLINKIYKIKVKYYHTDNKDTGNKYKFIKIFDAYKRIKNDR